MGKLTKADMKLRAADVWLPDGYYWEFVILECSSPHMPYLNRVLKTRGMFQFQEACDWMFEDLVKYPNGTTFNATCSMVPNYIFNFEKRTGLWYRNNPSEDFMNKVDYDNYKEYSDNEAESSDED